MLTYSQFISSVNFLSSNLNSFIFCSCDRVNMKESDLEQKYKVTSQCIVMSINRIDELRYLDRKSHSLADQSFKNFKSGKRKEDNCECCTPNPSWLKPDDSTMCLLALKCYFITTTISAHCNNLKAFLWLAQRTIDMFHQERHRCQQSYWWWLICIWVTRALYQITH